MATNAKCKTVRRERTRGRPSLYRPDLARQAAILCRLGAINAELAAFFHVDTTTIWRWQLAHPEFCNAVKAGKEVADERVKRALYSRAVGYGYDAEKVFLRAGDERPVRVQIREHVVPNVTAAIFWLKNRQPHEWRERRDYLDNAPADPEADASRCEAINRMESLLEERARMGLPPLFPANRKLAIEGKKS